MMSAFTIEELTAAAEAAERWPAAHADSWALLETASGAYEVDQDRMIAEDGHGMLC
jgi:hypothetical protein